MKFPVTLERNEDGVWTAECPSIPGCVSQGQTEEEASENLREAIRLCLEVRAERGEELIDLAASREVRLGSRRLPAEFWELPDPEILTTAFVVPCSKNEPVAGNAGHAAL